MKILTKNSDRLTLPESKINHSFIFISPTTAAIILNMSSPDTVCAEKYKELLLAYRQAQRKAKLLKSKLHQTEETHKTVTKRWEVKVEKLYNVVKCQKKSRGRNKTKTSNFDGYEHANNSVIAVFCRTMIFPNYKFIEESSFDYTPDVENSLCHTLLQELDFPEDCDREHYWYDSILPILNKKICEIRSNSSGGVKYKYKGEWISLFEVLC